MRAQPTSRPSTPSPPASKRSPPSTHRRRRRHPSGASSGATKRSTRGRRWGSPPPAVVDPGAPLWPYGPFWNVPQLGSEPVRGTGCGSQGQIGDVIPDGLWAGYVTNEGTRRSASTCCASSPAPRPARDQRGHRQHRQQRARLSRRQQQHHGALGARCARDRAARQRAGQRRVRRERRRPAQSATAAPGVGPHRRRSGDVDPVGLRLPGDADPPQRPTCPPPTPTTATASGRCGRTDRSGTSRNSARAITRQRMRGERAARSDDPRRLVGRIRHRRTTRRRTPSASTCCASSKATPPKPCSPREPSTIISNQPDYLVVNNNPRCD